MGLKGLFFGESTRLDQDNQLFLYRTVGNRFALVCQEYSPYTGFRFRLKERSPWSCTTCSGSGCCKRASI